MLSPINGNNDSDYCGRFMLRFHALINVYPSDVLSWEPVPGLVRTSSWTGSMFSLRGLSVGLEFPVWQLAESDYWREQFQTISEDVSVRNVLMHSAQWRFHDDALYKSTIYLLTCLLTCLLDTACLLCSPYGTFSTEPVASIFRMR